MDREKVIKGLECCLGSNDCDVEPEEDCPYKGMCLCAMALRFDVLALLKEQEPVIAHWDNDTGHWIDGDRNGTDEHERTTGEMIDTFRCSWCGYYLYWKTPFCPNCGAKMEGA